jgi:hypothetical protein
MMKTTIILGPDTVPSEVESEFVRVIVGDFEVEIGPDGVVITKPHVFRSAARYDLYQNIFSEEN